MPSFQRAQVATLCERLAEPPSRIIALFGPRQTGKTTVVRQALQQIKHGSRYFAVDEPESSTPRVPSDTAEATFRPSHVRDEDWWRDWLVRNWEEARLEAEQSGGFVLVFDEVQKISNWSETVKGLWDADRARECPLHVVILGSAPLLMQRGMSESLAGRYESIRVTHWSFDEMSEPLTLTLPTISILVAIRGPPRSCVTRTVGARILISSLIEPNIERDILAMQRVDKPALLKRLFELGAAYSGQILSYTKMLGQLQDAGNTTTLARYLDLLSNAGLITGLPKYAVSASSRRASSPKLNVLNTALMTTEAGYTFEEAQADRTFWGRLVESAVGAHLFNTATDNIRLYYWRDGAQEVDFVLQRGPHIIPIEVKSGPNTKPIQGMGEFTQRFKSSRSFLVGEGGIPLDEFLTVPAPYWFEEI